MTAHMHDSEFKYSEEGPPILVHLKTAVQGVELLVADTLTFGNSTVLVDSGPNRYMIPWYNVAGISQDLPT